MKYKINRNLTIRNIADETFVMDRDKGIVHSFNKTGAFIWNEIAHGSSLEDIVTKMHSAFTASGKQDEEVKEDTFQFLIRLEKENLIKSEEL